jgi:hypothetical protein
MKNSIKVSFKKKIENSLKKRWAEYPRKGAGYLRLTKCFNDFTDVLLKQIAKENCRYDNQRVDKIYDFVNSPIFIGGSMKSGTTLLSQLLDGNSELLVLPGDSHYFNNSDRFSNKDLKKIANYWVGRMISPTGKPPFWLLQKGV